MAYKVRFVEPDTQWQRLKDEMEPTILGTLAKGDLILRQQLVDFEKNLADYCGTKYAVGVNSGFHALHLSLVAAGIGTGDEVITVAHTFLASISAIVLVGAKPVLVDVCEDFNMDMDAVEKAITPKTRGIMPVHLNGRVCDMDRLMSIAKKHNLAVIEDAAQALGAEFNGKRAGSFGLTGCFSFYPFKSLGAYGDGGGLTTDDEKIAHAARCLRYNGEDRDTREFYYHGFTALLDNVQAAVLDVKLRHFPSWVNRRREVAERYRKGLEGVGDLRLPHFPDANDKTYFDTYQNYVIRTKRRDELADHLRSNGVEILISWSRPIWTYPDLKLGDHSLPETEAICREVISLPLNSEISDENVDVAIDVVRRFNW